MAEINIFILNIMSSQKNKILTGNLVLQGLNKYTKKCIQKLPHSCFINKRYAIIVNKSLVYILNYSSCNICIYSLSFSLYIHFCISLLFTGLISTGLICKSVYLTESLPVDTRLFLLMWWLQFKADWLAPQASLQQKLLSVG